MSTKPGIPEDARAITVDWMRQALTIGGKCDVSALKEVKILHISKRSGFFGTMLVCHLIYHEGKQGGPTNVIVKLANKDPKSQRINRSICITKREFFFYSEVCPDASIPSPTLLFGEYDKESRLSVLVLGGLKQIDDYNPLQVASLEQAKTAIRAVAKLHGRYWNKHKQLPLSEGFRIDSLWYGMIVHLIYIRSADVVLERFGHIFDDQTRNLIETFKTRFFSCHLESYQKPLTMVHGDYHLGNLIFEANNPDEMSVIDWQLCGIANGMEDLTTFIVTDLSSEMRRRYERELVEEYHQIVCNNGAEEFTHEKCWESYRKYVLFRLVPLISAAAVVKSSDQISMKAAENYLLRLQTAIKDLRADEFLPPVPRFWSLSNFFTTLVFLIYKIKTRLG